MPPAVPGADDPPMTRAELQVLVADAAAFDAVVVLWRTPHGTQPVFMPRSLGRSPGTASGDVAPTRPGGAAVPAARVDRLRRLS
jgi:hypothetical protein